MINCNHKNSKNEWTIEIEYYYDELDDNIKQRYLCSNSECKKDITNKIMEGVR